MTESGLITTGIAGLDEILLGGDSEGQCHSGAGRDRKRKDPDGHRVYLSRNHEFGEPGLIVVFETAPDKLIRDTAELRLGSG